MNRLHAWVICAASVIVAVTSHAIQPTEMLVERLGEADLESMVPENFGPWRRDFSQSAGVIDPQLAGAVQRVYSRTLSRVYVADDGYRVMLSIGYNRDHSDDKDSFHLPEGCYHAQGFVILNESQRGITSPYGEVPARRLATRLGEARPEPVSYWTTVGQYAALTLTDRKLASLRYSLRGLIPDGLLFRVSSIDPATEEAYGRQDQFVRDLIAALPPEHRRRLAGLGTD